MTEKDRQTLPSEAVITAMADTWAERTGIAEKLKSLPSNLPTAEMRARHDELVLRQVKLSYEEGVAAGWQAARDYYAPKVAETDAVRALLDSCKGHDSNDFAVASFIVSALKAAGVQFRDEPNPEPGSCP